MKPSDFLTGSQPTGPKAPVYPAPLVPAEKGSTGGAPATVAVREMVKLARQQAPEGARIAPVRTHDAIGLCWRGFEGTPYPSSDDGNA